MPELMTRIRSWLGLPERADPERQAVRQRLADQDRQIRLAVVDAGIDAQRAKERRRSFTASHPGRRAGDA